MRVTPVLPHFLTHFMAPSQEKSPTKLAKIDAPGSRRDANRGTYCWISRPPSWGTAFEPSVPRTAVGVNEYMYALSLRAHVRYIPLIHGLRRAPAVHSAAPARAARSPSPLCGERADCMRVLWLAPLQAHLSAIAGPGQCVMRTAARVFPRPQCRCAPHSVDVFLDWSWQRLALALRCAAGMPSSIMVTRDARDKNKSPAFGYIL